jgi:RND family efflux transporter MFP subunit
MSCGNQQENSIVEVTETIPTKSFTLWSDKTELFVEFPALVVGEPSRFAAHFTILDEHQPVREGQVTVSLVNEDKGIRNTAESPSSPGIFSPTLQPKTAGNFKLIFELKTSTYNDTLIIHDVIVYATKYDAIETLGSIDEGGGISFLKEQAWKIGFATEQVKRQPITEVIHTSGEIKPVKGEEKVIAAKSSGIVFFKSKNLQEGRDVRNGERLFSISSEGLLKANLEEKYQVAKARIDKTKSDFERAEGLLKDQIIGQKEFESRKMEYNIAQAEFQTLTKNYNAGGQSVASSMTGIVKKVMVTDGQFVEEGTPLIEITSNRRLILQAEVSQSHLRKLQRVKSANFKTPYQTEVQSLDDYNGKLISYGKVINPGSSFIPVLFELDNLHDLIPGSFVELFLLTNPSKMELVIPKSALMQDYSLNYVYIQTGGESFEKREVKLGVDDGVNIQVLSGVSEGEWVVTEGAYQIKMASMSSTIPAHGHEH